MADAPKVSPRRQQRSGIRTPAVERAEKVPEVPEDEADDELAKAREDVRKLWPEQPGPRVNDR